jgi:hypothetical protein
MSTTPRSLQRVLTAADRCGWVDARSAAGGKEERRKGGEIEDHRSKPRTLQHMCIPRLCPAAASAAVTGTAYRRPRPRVLR